MIGKKLAIHLLAANGDSIIEAVGMEPSLCTTDFSNKFIRRVRRTERFPTLKGRILLFNWTTYKFDAIEVKNIIRITPLAEVLDNKGAEHG